MNSPEGDVLAVLAAPYLNQAGRQGRQKGGEEKEPQGPAGTGGMESIAAQQERDEKNNDRPGHPYKGSQSTDQSQENNCLPHLNVSC
jgi:hypothetical protein